MASPRLPELIASGGNVSEYPENTLPALRSALELGARHVSFDVQLSSDRTAVLLNESSLQRIAGVARNALEMTWSDISEVRVTDRERFQERYTDIGIPSLAQAASLIAEQPEVTAFVELKRASLRAFGHEIVVHSVCDILKPIARQCVVTSYDLAAVHHVRQITSLRIGWRLSEYTTLSALKCEALAPDYVLADHQLLTDGASRLWRGPWRWVIYDAVSRKLAVEMAARGARLVGTSQIRTMLRQFRNVKVP